MNSDARGRLPMGSQLDENYIVVEYLNEYDTDTALFYKVREQGISSADYFIIQEYYPITGYSRNADNSLSIDENLIDKQQFDKGRAHFFKAYLDMSKPGGDQRFGRPVDYQMFNETAYCIFEYSAYDFQQKIQSISSYANLPVEYLPYYQSAAEFSYDVSDDALTIKGIDFNSDVYSYLLQGGVDAFVGHIREGVSSDRDALYDMLVQLDEFEAGDSDNSMGERRSSLTLDDMEKELGLHDHEWRLLRLLIKPDDEFYSWFISGECSGVAMSRNGRTFKSWVRAIS